jgi:hypothetical protein
LQTETDGRSLLANPHQFNNFLLPDRALTSTARLVSVFISPGETHYRAKFANGECLMPP